jgi:hypothetical protein
MRGKEEPQIDRGNFFRFLNTYKIKREYSQLDPFIYIAEADESFKDLLAELMGSLEYLSQSTKSDLCKRSMKDFLSKKADAVMAVIRFSKGSEDVFSATRNYLSAQYQRTSLGILITGTPFLFEIFNNQVAEVEGFVNGLNSPQKIKEAVVNARYMSYALDWESMADIVKGSDSSIFKDEAKLAVRTLLEYKEFVPLFRNYTKDLNGWLQLSVALKSKGDLIPLLKTLPGNDYHSEIMDKFGVDLDDLVYFLSTHGSLVDETGIIFSMEGIIPVIVNFENSVHDWGDRVIALFGCLKAAGLDIGNDDLDKKILKLTKYDKYSKLLSGGKRHILLAHLRERFGDTQLDLIRQNIRTRRSKDFLEKRESRLFDISKTVRELESADNPLVKDGIARRVGYEVEFDEPTWINHIDTVLSLFPQLGIKMGIGGTRGKVVSKELSPGPFWSPETGNIIFRMFVDAGLIDFYKRFGMTMHFSLEIPRRDDIDMLIKGMYLTGYAYEPRFTFQTLGIESRGSVRMDIFTNHQIEGENYFECKAFDLMTAHGFEENFRLASYLAWALAAWQDVHLGTRSKTTPPQWECLNKLATVWETYLRCLSAGFESIGINHCRGEEVFFNEWRKMDREIRFVYPDIKSRFEDPHKVEEEIFFGQQVRSKRVVVNDKEWPNIVAFGQDIAEEAVAEILEITRDYRYSTRT